MQAYMDYQAGLLRDTQYSAEEVAMALAGLPVVE
jgi:tryptophan synthase beta chain